MIAPLAWAALGMSVLLIGGPGGARTRVTHLAGGGRLVRSEPAVARWRPPVPPAWVGCLAVAVGCGGVGAAVGGVVIAVPGAAAGLTAWTLGRRAVDSRAGQRDADDLLRAVRLLIAELAAGAGPPSALGAAAEVAGRYGAQLASAASQAARGGVASRTLLDGPDELRPLGHAWRIAEDSGAPTAVVLERVAADLAAAVDQRRSVAVALAGPRSSAALLAGLPLLGIGLGLTMGADPLGFLLDRPAGRLVCAAGIGLDLAGIAWMARILRRAERAQ